MASPPPPATDSSETTTPASEETTSSPPPPTGESSPPPAPPSGDSSSPPPPSENSSPPPPEGEPTPPPPSASPPPASPPPQEESSPPPPSSESPPPKDSSQSPPPPSENSSPPPPSSSSQPTAPPSNDNNNHPPPNTFSPPPPSSGSSFHMPPPPSSKLTPSPPPPHKSHSSNGGSSSSSNKSDSSDSSSNVAVIAGIAVAGVLILAVIIIAVMCSRKKKKRKPYYMDPGRGPPPGGDYYHGSANPWQSPQTTDHVVKLPPPPGLMGTPVGGGGGWAAPPPPPPPGLTSSEYSSGFSGPHHTPLPPPSPSVGGNMGLGFSKSQFSYEELATATSGFSQANLLGQGGFGYVHKGVLPNGQVVAVKSLKSGSGQGEREFQAEVEIISRVHHRHLVSLVGYCIADGQRMLVYEFVPNSTLEFHLHGKGRPVMDFTSRLRIALGSAKGLAYLHEDCHPRIIHRDIKAANILLDDNYEAMVADFGLAKLTSDNFTHVSTRVMGTFGYLAPEYASSGKLTEKSDVFSFGVMLLELITGRRPVDPTSKYMEDSLVDWARPLLQKAIEDGDYGELVDPRLEGNFATNEMARLVTCAAASIRHSARRRPKMSQIVRALEGDASLDDLKDGGAKPGQSGMYSSNQGGDRSYDTGMYNADMMKFRKMVLDSQEINSSEYGATSEYGLNPSSSSSESGNSGPHRQKL